MRNLPWEGSTHLCSLKKEASGSRIYEATRCRGKIRGRVTRSSSNDNCPHPGSSDNYKSHVNAKNCQHTGDTDTYECSDTTSQRGHQARQMPRGWPSMTPSDHPNRGVT